MLEAKKPVIPAGKLPLKAPKFDAEINQNQSSLLAASDSDMRNNNAVVVNKAAAAKSSEKSKPDDENDKVIETGKSGKNNKTVPATLATSKQTPIDTKQNQKALNNNNTQQQNGGFDGSHSTSAIASNNNGGKANVASMAGPAASGGGKLSAVSKQEQRLAEKKKRQQEEEERQSLEEKKRLELIAAQRKAKLVDQNAPSGPRSDVGNKRNSTAASVAPWSNIGDVAATSVDSSPLNFAEIQKAERERRAEQFRMEQSLREQQSQAILEQQQQKDAVPKWKLKPQANQIKSLAEIQAEESKARQSNIQQISTTNVRATLCDTPISPIHTSIRSFRFRPS